MCFNMEDNAGGMVRRLALKTRFSQKGMGFDSSVFRQILTGYMIVAVAEVWNLVVQVRFLLPRPKTESGQDGNAADC